MVGAGAPEVVDGLVALRRPVPVAARAASRENRHPEDPTVHVGAGSSGAGGRAPLGQLVMICLPISTFLRGLVR